MIEKKINNIKSIDDIKKDIEELKKNLNINKYSKKNNIESVKIYDFFILILSSIIVAFGLNQIYKHFFGYSKLVFAIILILSIFSGLINFFRLFFRKTGFKEKI